MLDTLNQLFAPQWRPDPRCYHSGVLAAMEPHRTADGYRLQLRVVPDESNVAIAAAGTFESKVVLPTRSRLWAISSSSSAAAGFDLQLRSEQTGQNLFGRRTFYANVSGQSLPTDSPASRQFLLPRPLLLMGDGQEARLTVQIWNRAAAINTIQVVLWFSTPEA